jgi:uncharacterized protein YjbI with pentapeptide repeats
LSDNGYEIRERDKLIGRVDGNLLRDNIIEFFTDNISSDDLIVFYFSGHGYYDERTTKTYLVSSDFNKSKPLLRGFSFDDLTTLVENCPSSRVVVILDCCYSGALKLEGKGDVEDIADLAKNSMSRNLNNIDNVTGRCILASSLDIQESFKMKGEDYSLFSYHIIRGLEGISGESVDDKGNVTVDSLSRHVEKQLQSQRNVNQRPIKKIVMSGDIVLASYPNLSNQTIDISTRLQQLLLENNSKEFNELRRTLSSIDFSNIDLHDITLNGFDFSVVDFQQSSFTKVRFNDCNFTSSSFISAAFVEVAATNCTFVSCFFNNCSIQTAAMSGTRFDYSRFFSSKLEAIGFENCSFYYTLFGYNSELYPNVTFVRSTFKGIGFSKCTFYQTDFIGVHLNAVAFDESYFHNTDFTGARLEVVGFIFHMTGLINFNYAFLDNVKLKLQSGREDAIVSFTAAYRDDFAFDIHNDPIGNIVIIGIDNSIFQDSNKSFFNAVASINKLLLNKPEVTLNKNIQIRRVIDVITKKLPHMQVGTNDEYLKIKESDFQEIITSLLSLRDKNNDIYINELKEVFDFLRQFMKQLGFSLDNILNAIIAGGDYPSSVGTLTR